MWTLMLHIAYSVYVENKILIFFPTIIKMCSVNKVPLF